MAMWPLCAALLSGVSIICRRHRCSADVRMVFQTGCDVVCLLYLGVCASGLTTLRCSTSAPSMSSSCTHVRCPAGTLMSIYVVKIHAWLQVWLGSG